MQTKEVVETDLIDMGAVSVETRGGTEPVQQDLPISAFREENSLSQD